MRARTHGPRSFDAVTVGQRETDAWAAYHRHEWPTFLRASVAMVAAGFGMNGPDTARACDRARASRVGASAAAPSVRVTRCAAARARRRAPGARLAAVRSARDLDAVGRSRTLRGRGARRPRIPALDVTA